MTNNTCLHVAFLSDKLIQHHHLYLDSLGLGGTNADTGGLHGNQSDGSDEGSQRSQRGTEGVLQDHAGSAQHGDSQKDEGLHKGILGFGKAVEVHREAHVVGHASAVVGVAHAAGNSLADETERGQSQVDVVVLRHAGAESLDLDEFVGFLLKRNITGGNNSIDDQAALNSQRSVESFAGDRSNLGDLGRGRFSTKHVTNLDRVGADRVHFVAEEDQMLSGHFQSLVGSLKLQKLRNSFLLVVTKGVHLGVTAGSGKGSVSNLKVLHGHRSLALNLNGRNLGEALDITQGTVAVIAVISLEETLGSLFIIWSTALARIVRIERG